MKMINTLLIFISFFSSCKKDCLEQGAIIDEGEIVKEVSIQLDSSTNTNEYVIRNASENLVGAKIKIGGQTSFDTINFNNYSLLGKLVSFSPNGIVTRRKVTINNQTKLVNCTIEKEECRGRKKIKVATLTRILINKIPDDYEVVFNVIEK